MERFNLKPCLVIRASHSVCTEDRQVLVVKLISGSLKPGSLSLPFGSLPAHEEFVCFSQV